MTGNKQMIINWLLKQPNEVNYTIKELKDSRTLKQNSLMWQCIYNLSVARSEDPMDIYIQALEDSNAKYEYLLAKKELEEELRKNFRAVKYVRDEIHNNKVFGIYKVFIGSSKMDKEEFSVLMETILRWCAEENVPTMV